MDYQAKSKAELIEEIKRLKDRIARSEADGEMVNSASPTNDRVFELILDSLGASVYVSDMETYEVLWANKFVKDIHGHDMVGRPCYEVLQENQAQPCPFCNNDKLLDASGRPTGVQQREFCNTRTNRWVAIKNRAIRWADGRMVRLEYAADITNRKNMVQRQMEQEKMMGVLETAGTVCHELNQPLQTILGQVDLLLMSLHDEKSKNRMEIIGREAERIAGITHKLQRLTRHEITDYLGGTPIIDLDKSSF